MLVKRIFTDYQTSVNQIISSWQEELEKAEALGDKYIQSFVSQSVYEHNLWRFRSEDNEKYYSKSWSTLEKMSQEIQDAFQSHDQKVKQLQSFLADSLDLSQKEPVYLDKNHNWYFNRHKENTVYTQNFYKNSHFVYTEIF